MNELQAPVVVSNELLADVSAELRVWLDELLAKQPTDKISADRQRVVLLLDSVNISRAANPSRQPPAPGRW